VTFPLDRAHPPRRLVYRDEAHHLELRPWAMTDTEAQIVAIEASLPELRAFMPWSHFPITREGQWGVITRFQSEYWAGREYIFGVFDGAGAVVGGAGLHPRTALNPRALEVGYWCHSGRAGQGLTTLVARILIAFAFDHFGCDRFQVMHDEANRASQRVVEKCGFLFEGIVRNATSAPSPELLAGGYQGTGRHRSYSLLPEDLAALAWLPAVRAGLAVEDALGQAVPRPHRG
jgi:RimJ/RimL family protein N-acetyltransferase